MKQYKKMFNASIVQIILIIITLVSIFPLVWIVLASFKTELEMFRVQGNIFPNSLYLENYKEVLFGNNSRLQFLKNSLIISLVSTFVVVLVSSTAAFGFAKFKIKNSQHIEFWILSTRMMPPIAALIPLSIIIRKLNLFDTHLGIIILYVLFNVPYATWMLTIFFRQLPHEIDEAAMIDGCSWFQVFRIISLPQILSGLFSVATLVFIFTWNELLFAMILTGRAAKTLPVAITEYAGGVFIRWELMAAAATLQILPAIIIVIFLQKYLISGLSLGSVKG